MKILVIGSGFLGTPIVKRLEAEGHELLILSRTYKTVIQSRQIVGNFFDEKDVLLALSWGPQVVIHTAWVAKQRTYLEDPSNSEYADCTIRLAHQIANSSVEHLIILGTCAEYGRHSSAVSAGRTELNPQSFYANQKVIAFNATKKILQGSNTRLTWARVFHPYGPNQEKHRLIPYLINSLMEGNGIQLKDTTTIHDWITTRDISSAISWVINHRAPQEIDVGTGIGHSNIELLEHLRLLMGKPEQVVQINRLSSTARNVIQVDQDSPLFVSGWQPQDDLISGLKWILKK